MDSFKDKARNDLTPEQKAKVRPATEKDAKVVELSVEELEERIAPRHIYPIGPGAGSLGTRDRRFTRGDSNSRNLTGRFTPDSRPALRLPNSSPPNRFPTLQTNFRRVPWTAPRARAASS